MIQLKKDTFDLPWEVGQISTSILLIEDNKSDVLLFRKMLRGGTSNYSFEITDVARLVDAFNLVYDRTVSKIDIKYWHLE